MASFYIHHQLHLYLFFKRSCLLFHWSISFSLFISQERFGHVNDLNIFEVIIFTEDGFLLTVLAGDYFSYFPRSLAESVK